MKRRILSVVTAVALCLSLCPATASAVNDPEKVTVGGVTLTAGSTPIDASTGEGKDVTCSVAGESTPLPGAEDITRTGFTFGGWYENADFSGPAVTAIDGETQAGAKTLYVRWAPPAGMHVCENDLDFNSAAADSGTLETDGYHWNAANRILTLKHVCLSGAVTLPDAAVSIVTEEESVIGTLIPPDNGFGTPQANNMKLTFSGPGTLTVQQQISITGGDNNELTIAADANVIANGGVFVGADAGKNGIVTVNGRLTAKDENRNKTAVYTGSVALGNAGVLEVSGEGGVQLNGMPKKSSEKFNNLFIVAGNGRFTANCSTYNIQVTAINSSDYPTNAEGATNAGAVIALAPDYLPEDCEARANNNQINLVHKSTGEVYKGIMTIHKNHIWSSAWTDGGGDTHWHACTFAGCTAKQPGSEHPHYYSPGATACRDCNHPRPAGAPDSASDVSGTSNLPGSSSASSYSITVEPAAHGEVIPNRHTAWRGNTVTLTVTPDSGYELDTLTVTDHLGNELALTGNAAKYTFTMPGGTVTVHAVFREIADGYENCPGTAAARSTPSPTQTPTRGTTTGSITALKTA